MAIISLPLISPASEHIMLKRKVAAGGYEESSNASDIDGNIGMEQLWKKTKSAPYAPPRFIASSRSGSGTFQLPSSSARSSLASRHVSVLSRHSTPATETAQTARSTPDIQTTQASRSRSSTPHILAQSSSMSSSGAVKPNLNPSAAHSSTGTRSMLVLERQLNDMADTIEECKRTSDEWCRSTSEKIDRILDAVWRLVPAENLAPQALNASAVTSVPSDPSAVYLSNPIPTPELIAIVSKVVSEARSRIGKKKGGADDNSCKEHARQTLYRMLGITAAREIRPFFEDEYGEPDTLPTQFVDPDTRYCRPYPHWKMPLTKQVAWIPTFILRFRTTIPKDQSELSNMLRNLSDEQIVTLLNDGPFKSGQAAWRDMKKTDTEIEAMRSSSRRYQRIDRKAAIRTSYIRLIPSLQGPEWEYLGQAGYMSQDESDEEGMLVTKRPNNRSKWETNLYEAIHAAERKRARAKPGLCPRLPPRRIELVKRPFPQLERGTGNAKVVVRIAACGISKSWREKNWGEIQKSIHLINMKAVEKPDIRAFLEENPMLENGCGEGDIEAGELQKDQIDSGAGADGEGADRWGDWKQGNYEEEESGAVLDVAEKHGQLAAFGVPNTMGEQVVLDLADEHKMPEPTSGVNMSEDVPIPIDPALLSKELRCHKNQLSDNATLQSDLNMLSELPEPLSIASGVPMLIDNNLRPDQPGPNLAEASQGLYPASLLHDMPPPPLLNHNPAQALDQATSDHDSPIEAKKNTRSNKVPPKEPKKRGRPPGSKNKKHLDN